MRLCPGIHHISQAGLKTSIILLSSEMTATYHHTRLSFAVLYGILPHHFSFNDLKIFSFLSKKGESEEIFIFMFVE